ncbi:MAG: metallophosphoesterase family protein [Acidobacteriota bacterium]|nr:metallophosphoesterase family protein [Acidobacteriota bacterium]
MSNRTPEDPDARRRRTEERERLVAHRGLATWGEKLVPLGRFREATEKTGRRLSRVERDEERSRFLSGSAEKAPIEGPYSRVAVCGGVYNNHFALTALLDDAARRGAEAVYCLGDLGGFGPNPEKVRPLLEQGEVLTIQGNYEASLSTGHDDCDCGYTDPRDNHFAEVSYGYTASHASPDFKRWMGTLPKTRRVNVGSRELLLVHGSPRRINEFLFQSTTPVAFLEVLLDQHGCDGFLCTHTGLHWHRQLPSGRDVVNVGVIGRPANDGNTHVWYSLLEERNDKLNVELLPLEYDHDALAKEMRTEELPEEFVETVLSGWWTTCLEILPARERSLSRF